jgi:hypothetical protein
MTWDYTTLGTVAPGDVLRANSGTAAYNNVIGNIDALRVPPAVSVYYGTATTYTQDTDIVWTNEDYDTDGMWASGASVTIQTAGLYVVTFTGRATSTSSAGARAALLFSGDPDGQSSAETTSDFRWSLSMVRSLSASDTITARLQWGGTITLQGNTNLRPTLTVTWLGQVS